MRRFAIAAVVVAAAATTTPADVLTGEVVATDGAWEGDTIITTATVRTATGDVVVRQLGGWADGYGMLVMDGELPLEAGLQVAITARRGARAWIADEVRELDAGGRQPYVRTVTKRSHHPLYWAASCVQIGYGVEGTAEIPGDDERTIIEQSLRTWNDGIAGCSHQNFVSLGPIDREVSGRDFVTVIKFRDVEWCRPAADGKEGYCHSRSAAGLTTVVFVDDPGTARDGEIVDADIELNGKDFAISTGGVSGGTAACLSDLGNTLTHELGHVLGLEHTCRTGNDGPRLDNTGAQVPVCDNMEPPLISEATMYPFQDCAETKKASLSADDVQVMCDVYPLTDGPGVCKPPAPLSSGCCSGAPGTPGLALGLATLALVRRRRRH